MQDVAGHGCTAHKVSISLVFYHERAVVDQCAPAQALNDKLFLGASPIILH